METSTGLHSVVSEGHGNLSGLLNHHIVKVMNADYLSNEPLIIINSYVFVVKSMNRKLAVAKLSYILALHYSSLFVNMSSVSLVGLQVEHWK